MEYKSVSGVMLRLLETRSELKVHNRYLPDVLALLGAGKIRIVDDSSNPLIIGNPKPETTCIDCGQPTTPGKGSARCPGCWEDRCGKPAVLGECNTKKRAHAQTERCVNWRAYSHYK